MKNKRSFIVNAGYNFIYNGLNIAFPLITAPYVSRVLGAENLGKVNFATIVVNWFILFASFGIPYYGIREIAKVQDDKTKLDKTFSELFCINSFFSAITLLVFLFFVFFVPTFNTEKRLFLVTGIIIVLNIFSIDWFFQGIEKYHFITVRSLIIKTISLISVFIFLHNPSDYIIYAFISVISLSFGNFLNFAYSRNFVSITFADLKIKRHLRVLSVFFLTALVVNVYTNIDQLLLGFLVGSVAVAYTNRSRLVINTIAALSNSLINVAIPRASYYAKNDEKAYQELINFIPKILFLLTAGMSIYIFVEANTIMVLLGGVEFKPAAIVLRILSVVIIFSQFSTYFQYQILVPNGYEKYGLICSVIASFVSLLANFILIPRFSYTGAATASVISEFCSCFFRVFFINKLRINVLQSDFSNYFKVVCAAITSGVLVWSLTRYLFTDLIIKAGMSMLIFLLFYLVMLLLLQEKISLVVLNKIIRR